MNKKSDTSDRTQLNPVSLAEGFTQSELVVMDACPEKWYRSYNQMLRRQGVFHWYNVYGTAAHSSWDSFYANQTGGYELATLQIPPDVILTADDQAKLRYYENLLRVQMDRYCTYYSEDFALYEIEQTEQVIHIEHEGIRFSGKIDLVVREDERFGPWDHKTSSMFTAEVFAGWNFRFQFLFYAWLLWKHTGTEPNTIWWNGMRKPQLRQKQGESFEELIVRIEQNMIQEPKKYFVRQMLPLDEGVLAHFEKRILGPKLSRLKALTDGNTPDIIIETLGRNMNTSECVRFGKVCEFLALCKSGWALEGMSYVPRDTKHEELDSEE